MVGSPGCWFPAPNCVLEASLTYCGERTAGRESKLQGDESEGEKKGENAGLAKVNSEVGENGW